MEIVQNIIEYYDELYPVTDIQKKFFESFVGKYASPLKMLRVGCGTGVLENYLAEKGFDVTGIESYRQLLDCANRRRRSQVMSIRFFQMTMLEMNRFLGKGFYNVIACLTNRVFFLRDSILMRKFFFDCKQMLAKKGTVVLELFNFEKYNGDRVELPVTSSVRVDFHRVLENAENDEHLYSAEITTGTGKILPVFKDEPVFVLTKNKLVDYAKEAGFTSIAFYSDYEMHPFDEINSDTLIAVIS
ncbi:MAG: class I SAM-dependent methyltransferase [Treponema sp.]|nr:class I SAM-dependent methyltransferase [Treponema sp.]